MMKIELLSAEEVEAIHEATLRILSETGIVLSHPEGREILTGYGARVKADRVLLPAELVEGMLAHCVGQVRLLGTGWERKDARRRRAALAQPGRSAGHLRPQDEKAARGHPAGRARQHPATGRARRGDDDHAILYTARRARKRDVAGDVPPRPRLYG